MSSIELIARGLWLREDLVLLCRNLKHGYLYLPGGHVEFGESAAGALRRELIEETGVEVDVGPPLLLIEQRFDAKRAHHELSVVFHVEHLDPSEEIRSREDGIGFEWIPLAVIPELDVRPEPVRAWLASGGRAEDLPTPTWVSVFPE